jgi:hypothetical protein
MTRNEFVKDTRRTRVETDGWIDQGPTGNFIRDVTILLPLEIEPSIRSNDRGTVANMADDQGSEEVQRTGGDKWAAFLSSRSVPLWLFLR